MKRKIQLFYIHGGMTFRKQEDYRKFLETRSISLKKKIDRSGDFLDYHLGDDCTIIRPTMPLKENAHYRDWKIHFERYIPYLEDNIILIGKSLGGIFLAKYLSEHIFPKKILASYLVCPPFDDTCFTEDLVGGFTLHSDLSLLEKNSPHLTLMFSKDDDDVPLDHADKYKEKLQNADIVVYDSKNGHFQIEEFPEIVAMIKQDIREI